MFRPAFILFATIGFSVSFAQATVVQFKTSSRLDSKTQLTCKNTAESVLQSVDFSNRYFRMVHLGSRYLGFTRIKPYAVEIDCHDATPEKVAQFFSNQPLKTDPIFLKTVQAVSEEQQFLEKMEQRFGVIILLTESSYTPCANGMSRYLRLVRLNTALEAAQSCLDRSGILLANQFEQLKVNRHVLWTDSCAQPSEIKEYLCGKEAPGHVWADGDERFDR